LYQTLDHLPLMYVNNFILWLFNDAGGKLMGSH